MVLGIDRTDVWKTLCLGDFNLYTPCSHTQDLHMTRELLASTIRMCVLCLLNTMIKIKGACIQKQAPMEKYDKLWL